MTMTGDSPYAGIPLGAEFTFEISRVTVQEGRTFSQDALQEFMNQINLFVATQVAKRWDATGEPPTVLTVHVRCDVG